ncbi:hypothetical protein WYH_02677 [Croceibacterium atlanticum]|uniref:Uncharacterized protein n=3 Tax=Croceibacterium atlanticum TaxID=1267766 RepID=A0A0F7KWV9_9SPHN|nr:hypothetical protein WYH_02677 [Croceibacterium atlanticum]
MPLPGQLSVEINSMNATSAELTEAMNWIANDEALISDGHHLPAGRVAALIDALEQADQALNPPDFE